LLRRMGDTPHTPVIGLRPLHPYFASATPLWLFGGFAAEAEVEATDGHAQEEQDEAGC
jgi:hypothetical protein